MKRVDHILSHWHVLIDDFNTSGQTFYEAVEAAIRERKLPELTFTRHNFMEGGPASAKRQYLRVERKFVAFDICAAPYGRGFFFSWGLSRLGPKHPILYMFAFLVILWIVLSVIGGIFGDAISLSGWIILFPLILYGLGHLVRTRVLSSEENVLMIPFVGWLYVRSARETTHAFAPADRLFQLLRSTEIR